MELLLLTVMVHQDPRLQDTCLPGCNLVSQLQRIERVEMYSTIILTNSIEPKMHDLNANYTY